MKIAWRTPSLTKLKTLIIMNCSKTKNSSKEVTSTQRALEKFIQQRRSFPELLPENDQRRLLQLRRIIEKKHEEALTSKNQNMTKNFSIPSEDQMLSAFLRYSGRVFQRVNLNAWKRALKSPTLDIWILTAYHGIVRYTDFIPYYDLTVHDSLFSSKSMRRWWRENGLPDITWNAIKNIHPQKVIIIASKTYQTLLPMKKLSEPTLDIETSILSFPGGMGSLNHKGKWLNQYLLEYNDDL